MPCFVLDATALADQYLQLTCAAFEYPRGDLRRSIRFVGPILPASTNDTKPEWWPDLDDRPVVLVTQGTVANHQLSDLIGPTIDALAGKDVLLVVTTGDEDAAASLRKVAPANVRVAAFVPYDELLDRVDVMVTNGGYGGVQFALAHGVPLIVAGDTEEKPEIAARVCLGRRRDQPAHRHPHVEGNRRGDPGHPPQRQLPGCGPRAAQRNVELFVVDHDRRCCPRRSGE